MDCTINIISRRPRILRWFEFKNHTHKVILTNDLFKLESTDRFTQVVSIDMKVKCHFEPIFVKDFKDITIVQPPH